MEIWTHAENGQWKPWPQGLGGIDAVARADPGVDQVVVIESEPADDEPLFATIRLVKRLAPGPLQVIAGSEHPTQQWLGGVRMAGADRALLVPLPEAQDQVGPPHIHDAVELRDTICPALHARKAQGGVLSVCGRHDDRMVLSRRHFASWCLSNKDQCPHWMAHTPRLVSIAENG